MPNAIRGWRAVSRVAPITRTRLPRRTGRRRSRCFLASAAHATHASAPQRANVSKSPEPAPPTCARAQMALALVIGVNGGVLLARPDSSRHEPLSPSPRSSGGTTEGLRARQTAHAPSIYLAVHFSRRVKNGRPLSETFAGHLLLAAEERKSEPFVRRVFALVTVAWPTSELFFTFLSPDSPVSICSG